MLKTRDLLEKLVALGQRQFQAEAAAAELISGVLRKAGIPFEEQTFTINVPRAEHAALLVDGCAVECAATCFTSGVIDGKDVVLSSAMPMAESPDLPNINVNPYCPVISRANHYWQPAVAVSHEVLHRVLAGRTIRGEVQVSLVAHTARNLLIGDTVHPRTVVFTHYDSIGPGAFDNASGLVAVLEVLIKQQAPMDSTLFVLSGAEELSTDRPYYWGAGYRRFEEQHSSVLALAEHILVVDSVGSGDIAFTGDPRIIRRAFPLTAMETLLPRIQLLCGSLAALMPVYHSECDQLDRLSIPSIEAAASMLQAQCARF